MKKSSRFGLMQALMGKPRVEALHGPDVLGLVASGFLLGIGFASLMAWLKPGIFASSTKDQS
jgi:hypothetical protein